MYEKPSANNKVHLIKKLFNLKMAEGTPITQHLNEFIIITNQLSSMKIDFVDEIRTLILLESLPNSWEVTRMTVSNSIGKAKLNFDDTRDLILAEEVRRIDSGEVFGSGFALNVENRGRGNRKDDRSSNRAKSKSRHKGKSRPHSGQAVCWNCQKSGHFKKDCKNPKRKENNSANTVAVETVEDALVLAVHTQTDD